MSAQNVLVEDYKKLQLQFVICDSCYWCATAVSYPPNRCPSCGSGLNSVPLQPAVGCAE
ncbi:MAG TPA: hypothetical protein VMJ94_06750 [Nitrososphaera sp.]|nr:hypothetical protein [Nitrososphaera sp.]